MSNFQGTQNHCVTANMVDSLPNGEQAGGFETLSGSQKLAARWDVAFVADGLDQVGVEAVLAPRAGGDVEEVVVVLVGPVGPNSSSLSGNRRTSRGPAAS